MGGLGAGGAAAHAAGGSAAMGRLPFRSPALHACWGVISSPSPPPRAPPRQPRAPAAPRRTLRSPRARLRRKAGARATGGAQRALLIRAHCAAPRLVVRAGAQAAQRGAAVLLNARVSRVATQCSHHHLHSAILRRLRLCLLHLHQGAQQHAAAAAGARVGSGSGSGYSRLRTARSVPPVRSTAPERGRNDGPLAQSIRRRARPRACAAAPQAWWDASASTAPLLRPHPLPWPPTAQPGDA